MIIDPSTLTKKEMYKLLIGTVVPRPIAWVSTVNVKGEQNLAPFSFYNVVCTEPAMLAFSVGPSKPERGGAEKDTLANIRETKQFVINLVTLPLAEAMHISSYPFSPADNEFDKTSLTPIPSEKVRAPRVKESPIQMECELDQIIPLGKDHLVIGSLVCYHIEDQYYLDGKVDVEKLQVVGRLAGNYHVVERIFELPNER